MHSVRVPMWQTQFVEPVRTAHIRLWTLCHTIQHRAVLIIFPVNLQTITITQMLSSGGEGADKENSCTIHTLCRLGFDKVIIISWWSTFLGHKCIYSLLSVFILHCSNKVNLIRTNEDRMGRQNKGESQTWGPRPSLPPLRAATGTESIQGHFAVQRM